MKQAKMGPFRRLAPSVAPPTIDAETGRATFVFNTEEVGRDGHIVYNRGIRTDNFESNPTILFAHDDKAPPIARATAVHIGDPASTVDIEFTPREVYPFGATIGDLVRGGYLNACSMSWQPLKWKFSTDRNRPGGVDFVEVDLLEISIVPVPALPDAIATARANGIDTRPMFEWAERLLDTGGMTLVPRDELETLRRAAAMPKRSSKSAQTDKPATPATPALKRGLYDIGCIAYLLEQLGYAHDCAEYEADIEGDASEVPAMLGEALKQLGAALVAMTAEEVAELLAGHDADEDDGGELSAEARAHIAAGKTPRARAWRRGIALARAGSVVRAGKKISAANVEKLGLADAHLERAQKHHRALGEHHEAVSNHIDEAQDAHEKASQSHGELGEALQSAKDEPAKAGEHVARAAKLHRAMTATLEDIGEAHANADERNQDLGDSHAALGRSMKSAQRCMRSVAQDGTEESEPDNKDADELEESEKARANRMRLAVALQLCGADAA